VNTTQKFSLVSVELFFYVCPPISNAIGSTGRNGAFGIDFNMAVPYSWSISSKTRNKLIHSMNGNVVKLTDFFPRKKKRNPPHHPCPSRSLKPNQFTGVTCVHENFKIEQRFSVTCAVSTLSSRETNDQMIEGIHKISEDFLEEIEQKKIEMKKMDQKEIELKKE